MNEIEIAQKNVDRMQINKTNNKADYIKPQDPRLSSAAAVALLREPKGKERET